MGTQSDQLTMSPTKSTLTCVIPSKRTKTRWTPPSNPSPTKSTKEETKAQRPLPQTTPKPLPLRQTIHRMTTSTRKRVMYFVLEARRVRSFYYFSLPFPKKKKKKKKKK